MTHQRDILATGLRFPEGPLFDRAGNLWCSEIEGAGLVAGVGSNPKLLPTGGRPNGLGLAEDGRIWFCDGAAGAVRVLDLASGTIETRLANLDGPNDLAFDPRGNLVFTCCPPDSRTSPTGTVECLMTSGDHKTVADGLFFPNGLAFADGGNTLIVAETYGGRLWTGAWHSDGPRWDASRVLCVTTSGPNGPDGIAIHEDGRVYVAVYGSGCIDVFHSDGTRSDRLDTGARNPTSCAFDPAGRLGLVVTEAERGAMLSFPGIGPGAALFNGARGLMGASC